MRRLKGILLGCGLAVASMSVLTACNTVRGTAEGAGRDIQATANAVTPVEREHYVHHVYRVERHHHHHHMMKHKNMMKKADQTSTTDATPDATQQTTQTTTQQTTTDQTKTN